MRLISTYSEFWKLRLPYTDVLGLIIRIFCTYEITVNLGDSYSVCPILHEGSWFNTCRLVHETTRY